MRGRPIFAPALHLECVTVVITVRNKVVKVMFLQACVCPQGGVPDQVHPPGPGTPLDQVHPSRTRYTPWDQVQLPPDQVHPHHTQDQVHPPWTRCTPLGPGAPPGTRYTPLGPGTPPLGPGTGTPPRDTATPAGMHSCFHVNFPSKTNTNFLVK